MCTHWNCRKWLRWLWMGSLIGLAACSGYRLRGFVACSGCGSNAQKAARNYDTGWEKLSSRKLADAGSASDKAILAAAVKAFDAAIALNSRHAKAVFGRALTYQEQGETESAISGYTEAIRLHGKIVAAASYKWLIGDKWHIADFHVPNAMVAAISKTFYTLQCIAGMQVPGENDAAASDQPARDAVPLGAELAEAYLRRGLLYKQAGKTDKAMDDFTKAVLLDPGYHEAFCQRARVYLALGKYAEAIKDCQLAIGLQPNCVDAFLTLGSAILSSPDQQPDVAVQYLDEASRLDKELTAEANAERAQAYFNIGVGLTKAKKPLDAKKAFDDAERLDRKYVNLDKQYRTIADLAINGPPPRIAYYPSMPDPGLPRPKRQPFALLQQKEFDEVLRAFSIIRPIDAKCPDAWEWCGRGSAFLENNDPVSAIPDFGRAIELAPDFAQAYCLRGRAYTMIGDYDRARSDATDAIRLKPDCALAYFYRAAAYLKEKNFERTLADLDEAVKLDPELAVQARSSYADIYFRQGINHIAALRWDRAIASLEKAITFDTHRAEELNPQLAQAYRERGLDHANHSDFEEAVRDLKRAFELDKDNAHNHRCCGLTCFKMAQTCHDRGLTADERVQWQFAVVHLRRAIRLDPELEYILRHPLNDAQHNLDAMSAPREPTRMRP